MLTTFCGGCSVDSGDDGGGCGRVGRWPMGGCAVCLGKPLVRARAVMNMLVLVRGTARLILSSQPCRSVISYYVLFKAYQCIPSPDSSKFLIFAVVWWKMVRWWRGLFVAAVGAAHCQRVAVIHGPHTLDLHLQDDIINSIIHL